GVVDLAVVDPAGVDVERMAEMLEAHHRTFEMPAGRALAPGRIPFHLALLARRGTPPDREILRSALARDRIDPACALVADRPRQRSVVGHFRDVEIQAAVEQIAVLFDCL